MVIGLKVGVVKKYIKQSALLPMSTPTCYLRCPYGRMDVLVNNAGLMAIPPLSDACTDEWDRMNDIKGLLYGVTAALPVFHPRDALK